MTQWERTFNYHGKPLYYNRIQYNNPSERAVEVPIGFDFLANFSLLNSQILEVGNVLSYYENSLSDNMGVISRKIIDKFEDELGVDKQDLMELSSEDKYDAIVSISTVEHIAQGKKDKDSYGEEKTDRDLEGPLKAIAKIYDLLSPNGKALITVPFGLLVDGGWYIQFSGQYLSLLKTKYGIPPEAISTSFLKLVDREPRQQTVKMLWQQAEGIELSNVEYNYPFKAANAIAVIELTKQSDNFELNLDVSPSPLFYNKPYEIRDNMECLHNEEFIKIELLHYKTRLEQTTQELEQSQSLLNQTTQELEQSQSLLNQTTQELEQSNIQFYRTQSILLQFQSLLTQTQEELEQSQSLLTQTKTELEGSRRFQALSDNIEAQEENHYRMLMWNAWCAYQQGDLKTMALNLKESLQYTTLLPTETLANWLDVFLQFAAEKGCHFDTYLLINSVEWQELTRRGMNSKLLVSAK